ncbi:hypothetical protein BDR22DRAFT_230643 [Usnea florida]
MAEIGIAASIISVAAFGVSVATTLYETADIMKNANPQITALAKHVTQFTAVLNHMGQMLETEKINCSKEVLRDIKKIKHSCKRTFREIKSTVKAQRFQRLMWLFKRTKAMELEARLDSQQSMLQCMIHTLTVSKLSRMDSRSKEDSAHFASLKVEITLLKTFIKESCANVSALQVAENNSFQQSRAEYQPMSGDSSHPTRHHPYVDGSTVQSGPMGAYSAFEPPIRRSPSPTSNVPGADDKESITDGGGDDDDYDDFSSKKSEDQSDHDGAGPNRKTSNATGTISGVPYSSPFRESNLLVQMVPYNPFGSGPVLSDRLIGSGHVADSGTTSATQEVTKSVRALLDKWTTSGSAPISNILDEEAARENDEAELANKHRVPDPQYDRYRGPSPPLYIAHESGPERRGYSRRFEGHYMPPRPPGNYPQASYGEMDFSIPTHNLFQPPSRQLGSEILAILRSERGGIHYMKSNNFKQVHYVDQYPIYTCYLVPSNMIPYNEDSCLITELGSGLIRKEALDLLTYSYTRSETGNFSIKGNLGLGEIEELVRLSYQAVERNLEERSRTVIHERGLGVAISAMNRGMQYEHFIPPRPPRPGDWNFGAHDYFRDENPYRETPLPYLHTPPEYSSERRRAKPIVIPPAVEVGGREEDTTRRTRSEVRFTLPRMQPVFGTADIAKEAQTNSAKTNVPVPKTDDELHSLRQRLERAKKRKEEAEKAKDVQSAFDLSTYAIPELEAKLEKVLEQQRKEQEKPAAPVSQNQENWRSRPNGVEVESEDEDDEGESEGEAEYD